ncbi:uncharacterized protein KGF55_003979 [Candida pseudojiufengensis]|uniref:uncharacterized protein n=1 Tax=Candida pseudojiufengensis TaxID=497109 RepID=UPI00222594F3|nr:uncharacterized protein KGF55_003979 [Candida pseudojiufengensis]KAI5961662.1 hypothetical protein KGF55_003979 [Candida pseudojiufengensis]
MCNYLKFIIPALLLISSFYFLYETYGSSLTFDSIEVDYISPKEKLLETISNKPNYKTEGLNFQTNRKHIIPTTDTISEKLAKIFPYDQNKDFSKQLWQTWKVGLDDKEFPDNFKEYHESWVEKNPDFEFHVVPDEKCDEMIMELYKDVPDVIKAYHTLPKVILKADFFRYLILFAKGGIYSDLDTVALKPVSQWPSTQDQYLNDPINIGLTVGIEADPDRDDWAQWYARRIQFSQWTIFSKVGHPMLRDLISKITTITLVREMTGKLNEILDGKDQGNDIMNWTGPGIYTDCIFRYLNIILHESFDLDIIIDNDIFKRLEKPIVVDDVMLMPITSFSPGHNDESNHALGIDSELALVQHKFEGSWKNNG